MKIDKSTKFKIIFISIFFVTTFISQFLYGPPLFDNSIEIAKAIQNKFSFSQSFLKNFSKIVNYDYILLGIVIYFFPINYSYTFFLEIIIGSHLCNFIKLLFGDGRPFLQDKEEAYDILLDCSSSYGNPSAHSFFSISTYLSLAQCIIDFFELKRLYSILIYIFIGFIVLLINFSRILLGVHSIGQAIFGDTLGFTYYFIIFQIIKPYKREVNEFFQMFLKKKYLIINGIAFGIVLIYTSLGARFLNREGQDNFEELKEILKIKCPKARNKLILSYNSIYRSFYFTGYFGMVCGIICLTYFVKTNYDSNYEKLNFYYKNTNKKIYIIYLVKLLLLLICYIPYFVTSFKPEQVSLTILYIFGVAIPLFLFGFMLFGPHYIILILLKLVNKELYEPKKSKEALLNYYLDE